MDSHDAENTDGTAPEQDAAPRYDDPSAPDTFEPAPAEQPGYGYQPPPADPQPYGAPPEQQQQPYAAPPQQPYGPPAEQQPYAAPAPQPGYDQAGYGYQPPPGEQQQYGYAQQQHPYAAPAPAYGGYPQQPAPPRQGGGSRKTLIIVLAAAVVVAVVIAVVAVASGKSSSHKATAADAVAGYLKALADGDAEKALSYGQKPADTTYLTDAILKKQQALAPLRDIKTSSGATDSLVDATYSFGDQTVHESYSLTKVDGDWRLESTVVKASLLVDDFTVTLFGIPVKNIASVTVFPGPLQFAATTPAFAVTQHDKFEVAPSDDALIQLEASLSDAGKASALAALKAAMTACAKSKSLNPDNCPQSEDGLNLPVDQFPTDDTATWTAPTDYSAVKLEYDGFGHDVRVSGTLKFPIKYTAETFDGAKVAASDTVSADLFGEIDMSKTPPAYQN